jgi:urate oxidase
VKLVKIVDAGFEGNMKKQQVHELTCSVLLSGDAFETSYSVGDNSKGGGF